MPYTDQDEKEKGWHIVANDAKQRGSKDELENRTNVQQHSEQTELDTVGIRQIKMNLQFQKNGVSQRLNQEENQIKQENQNLEEIQVRNLDHEVHAIEKNPFNGKEGIKDLISRAQIFFEEFPSA